LQNLFTAIIDSDADNSASFSDQEIQILEMRLRNIQGITVNFDALKRQVLASDRTLESVLKLVENMDRDDLPEEERIFRLEK
jgi:hypothetical protein